MEALTFEDLAMQSELRSMAYVTYFIEAHRGDFLTKEPQVEQLQDLAKSRKLTWTVDYYQRGKSKPYDTPHDGRSLYQTIQSVVSRDEVKPPQLHGLGDDDAVVRFFAIGKDIFTGDYYDKLESILRKDISIAIPEAAKQTTGHNTSTNTSNNEDDSTAPKAPKAQSVKNKTRVAKPIAAQQPRTQNAHTTEVEQHPSRNDGHVDSAPSAQNDQSKSLAQMPASRTPGTTDSKTDQDSQDAIEDLLDLEIGSIMERIHFSIQVAVAAILSPEANKQPAIINVQSTPDVAALYKAAFGVDWRDTLPALATNRALMTSECLQCLIWAFIVEHIFGHDVLPGTLRGLLKKGQAPRTYLTPILAESKLDFDILIRQAMLDQFCDSEFRRVHMEPAVNKLANDACVTLILNGHSSLQHTGFLRSNWHVSWMRSLKNIFAKALALQVKLQAGEGDRWLKIFDHGRKFDISAMNCKESQGGSAIDFTVIPGVFQSHLIAGPKMLVKAEVKMMVVTSIGRSGERPSSSRRAGGGAEGDGTTAKE